MGRLGDFGVLTARLVIGTGGEGQKRKGRNERGCGRGMLVGTRGGGGKGTCQVWKWNGWNSNVGVPCEREREREKLCGDRLGIVWVSYVDYRVTVE